MLPDSLLLSRREWLMELTAAPSPLAVLLLSPRGWPLRRARLSYLAAEALIEAWLASLLPLLPPAARLCRYDAATAAVLLPAPAGEAEALLSRLLAAPFVPDAAYLRGECAGWQVAGALISSPPAEPFALLDAAERLLEAQLSPLLPPGGDAAGLLRVLPALLRTQAEYLPQQAQLAAETVAALAPRLGFGADEAEQLLLAAHIADLPLPRLLGDAYFSPGALSMSRLRAMQQHPHQAAELAAELGLSELAVAAIRAHHEQPDGGGYPLGLRGAAIPRAAALLRVAQVYAALRLPRPYQRALSDTEARQVLADGAGVEFDLDIVGLLLAE